MLRNKLGTDAPPDAPVAALMSVMSGTSSAYLLNNLVVAALRNGAIGGTRDPTPELDREHLDQERLLAPKY